MVLIRMNIRIYSYKGKRYERISEYICIEEKKDEHMFEYIFVINIFEYLNIQIYSSHSGCDQHMAHG